MDVSINLRVIKWCVMSDITMCAGKNCELKETCYRYKAEVNPYRQGWSDFDLEKKENEPCEWYWAMDNGNRK